MKQNAALQPCLGNENGLRCMQSGFAPAVCLSVTIIGDADLCALECALLNVDLGMHVGCVFIWECVDA